MRPRARHPLNVLHLAAVAAFSAAFVPFGVQAATPSHPQPQPKAPTPFLVALDPGHGGTPDDHRPDILFDPGAISQGGLKEKDLTLDVARRVRRLLEADSVKVMMTRTTDTFVDISPRMEMANAAGAKLYVSIHFNSFPDPVVEGAVVLYPGDSAIPFAQVMSDALAKRLAGYGFANGGILPKPDLWVHATMPAVTVEAGYLSNSEDALRLSRGVDRDAIAAGIRDGIEKQAPEIATLKHQIAAWSVAHQHPAALVVPRSWTFLNFGNALKAVLLLLLVGAFLERDRARPFALAGVEALRNLLGAPSERKPARRRRRARRPRRPAAGLPTVAPPTRARARARARRPAGRRSLP